VWTEAADAVRTAGTNFLSAPSLIDTLEENFNITITLKKFSGIAS